MNKLCFLAAFAAVPAMVASAEVEFTAKERVQICEVASAVGVVQVMENDDLKLDKKVEMVQQLTQVVRKAKSHGVSDEMLESSLRIVVGLDEDILKNFNKLFAECIQKWESENFKGSDRLRNAVGNFVKAYVAE